MILHAFITEKQLSMIFVVQRIKLLILFTKTMIYKALRTLDAEWLKTHH